MAESAGFDPVTVSWVPISGGRVVRPLCRLFGVDEMDITIGLKPNLTAGTPPQYGRRIGVLAPPIGLSRGTVSIPTAPACGVTR